MDNEENELDTTFENEAKFEDSSNNITDGENFKKRRTNVGPWKNVEEFNMVYISLFGQGASYETKIKACKKMRIWKLRSLNMTPASILSTLAIIEVQIKDESKDFANELQVLYSGAFTRFLNYMCSTTQKGKMKTMYQSAMDIGIDPFIVDLRHLCSHGQSMPSLNVLRRASDYCLDWLKEFYWDQEYKNQRNVGSKNVRSEDITLFDDKVSELFEVYDSSLLAIQNGCIKVNEARKFLSNEHYNTLKKFSNINGKIQLEHIQVHVIKIMENLIRQESSVKNLASVFITAFTKMTFIFEIPANLVDSEKNLRNLVRKNRKLFRSIAMHGFIERLFDELIYIAENSFETSSKRRGASFWANEIVVGFSAFEKFKVYCKTRKEKDSDFHIEKKHINDHKILSKEIKRIYSILDIDASSIIIFGDHYKRPWCLSFSKNYIEERLKNVTEYTKTVIKNCLSLVQPPLSYYEESKLVELINIYCGSPENEDENPNKNHQISNELQEKKYFTQNDLNCDISNFETKEENHTGIWFTGTDELDWHLCPLGRLPWE
ncbi:uncharacterized protein LOC129606780 [Condylostylus longicornis]|uniref:uncharacterized protein LOC129606780 n=1 Tax=Condylostylus longicornis TaxID=2530218 RepID=UPI00244DBBE8|nr:uncharacterized protein LOC129606780 [Condylostylus longicornis]